MNLLKENIEKQIQEETRNRIMIESNLFQFIVQKKIEEHEKYSSLFKNMNDSLIFQCIEKIGLEKLLKGFGIKAEPDLYLNYLYQFENSEKLIPFLFLAQLDFLYHSYQELFQQHGFTAFHKTEDGYSLVIDKNLYSVTSLDKKNEHYIATLARKLEGDIIICLIQSMIGKKLHVLISKDGSIYDPINQIIMNEQDYVQIYHPEKIVDIHEDTFSLVNEISEQYDFSYQKKIRPIIHK